MNQLNQFFKKLYSSPSLLWKAGAAMMFLVLAIAILFVPSLTIGFTDGLRYGFAGLLVMYGLFRLFTFYSEYKRMEDE